MRDVTNYDELAVWFLQIWDQLTSVLSAISESDDPRRNTIMEQIDVQLYQLEKLRDQYNLVVEV
jgi:hypothetical protein